MKEGNRPKPEESKRAEKIMTEEEKAASEEREKKEKKKKKKAQEENREYLERHLSDSEETIEPTENFMELVESDKNREVYRKDNITVEFEFADLEKEELSKKAQEETKKGKWKRIKSLTINDRQKEQTFHLEELFSSSQNSTPAILINLSLNSGTKKPSKVFEETNEIILNKPPDSASSSIALLHEIGHLKVYEKMNDQEKKKHKKSLKKYKSRHREIKEIDLKRTLQAERDAWAYTLKKIKPFLYKKGLMTREQIKDYIHRFSLNTYNKNVEKGLKHILEKNIEEQAA